MIRDNFFFFGIDDARFPLQARYQPINRLLEVDRLDGILALTRGAQRCLVDEIGEVGADEPGGARGSRSRSTSGASVTCRVCTRRDFSPALQVGPVDDHLAVEAARAQQGRVQDLRPVGGGQQDDAFLRIEAVHLGQELIERLFPLIVAAHHGTRYRAPSPGHPTASMKMILGAVACACAKRSRTRAWRQRPRTSRRSQRHSS